MRRYHHVCLRCTRACTRYSQRYTLCIDSGTAFYSAEQFHAEASWLVPPIFGAAELGTLAIQLDERGAVEVTEWVHCIHPDTSHVRPIR